MKIMKSQFSSSDKKTKVLKKIASRMRVGRKALDSFDDLCMSMEAKKDPFLKLDPVYAFLSNGRTVLGSGKSLSECFEGWLPAEQIVLIKTGEETGRIADAFKDCIELETQVGKIRKAIKGALFMPIFALGILLFLLVSTYQKGIPMMQEILPFDEWGDLALMLYDVTYIFGSDPMMTVMIGGGSFGLFMWSIPNLDIPNSPAFRNTLDKYMPFFGLYRTMQASIFLRSLATLLSAGVRVKVALDLIIENSTPYVANRVRMMRDQIAGGQDLADTFINPFLGEDGEDLSDMAKGDALELALEEVATETMANVLEVLPKKLGMVGKLLIASCLGTVIFGMGAFYEIVGSVS